MAEEKYVLISLEDEKAKNLAETLGNKTCKKILDLLAEKEASESEIANELSLPLNTADYNVKKLVKAGLIEEKKHFWSVKGKRIPVYKVSNKHIVISPKKTSNKLRSFIPVFLVAGIFTAFMLWYEKGKEVVVREAERVPEEAFITGAEKAVGVMEEAGARVGGFLTNISVVEWFLVVMWLGIIIFILINLTRRK